MKIFKKNESTFFFEKKKQKTFIPLVSPQLATALYCNGTAAL
jgi:hypothetical protein